jgi:16S rRNA (guanine527-N7)-methyltransferase
MESIGKKTAFLTNLISKLDLDDVEIHLGRAEQLAHIKDFRATFDCVLTRAVAKLNTLAELTLPFCRIGGLSVAQKQAHVKTEADQASHAFNILGGKLVSQIKISLGDLLWPRSLVVIRKEFNTPSKYPRRPGIPSKRPL